MATNLTHDPNNSFQTPPFAPKFTPLQKKLLSAVGGLAVLTVGLMVGIFMVRSPQDLRRGAIANGVIFSINPATVTTAVNGTFTVDMVMNPRTYSVTAASIIVKYPAAGLELTNFAPTTYFTETLVPVAINNTTGTATVTLGSGANPANAKTTSGVVARLTFRAKTNGTHVIAVDPSTQVAALNNTGDVANDTNTNGTVTVAATATATPIAGCTDSDGGKNYFVSGYVVMSNLPGTQHQDSCTHDLDNDTWTLYETYCDANGQVQTEAYTGCPNGCSNGACLPAYTATPRPATPTPTRPAATATPRPATPTPTRPAATATPTNRPTVTVTQTAGKYTLLFRLQGITVAQAPQTVTITIKNAAGSVMSADFPATPDQNGVHKVEVTDTTGVIRNLSGTYQVCVKAKSHLQKCYSVQMPPANNLVDVSNTEAIVGDVNKSNTITIEDVASVLAKYTTFVVPVTRPEATDVNNDGRITIDDVALSLMNYSDFEIPGDE